MTDLFDRPPDSPAAAPGGKGRSAPHPLADRLRPRRWRRWSGRTSCCTEGRRLATCWRRASSSSLILWGPPGVGKTTIARLLAAETDLHFVQISAIFTGVADLRKVFEAAQAAPRPGPGHAAVRRRDPPFQQGPAGRLPAAHGRRDVIVLVGATTENPSFELNAALLSRGAGDACCERLDAEDLELILAQRAETEDGPRLPLTAEARAALIEMADGDGRALLNLAEQVQRLRDRRRSALPISAAG